MEDPNLDVWDLWFDARPLELLPREFKIEITDPRGVGSNPATEYDHAKQDASKGWTVWELRVLVASVRTSLLPRGK